MRIFIFAIVLIIFMCAGCSSGGDISSPEPERAQTLENSHSLWGYFEGRIDTAAETLELTPLRQAEFHLNALPFLEPPPLVNLSIESLEFNGNIIEVDIGLRHPFLGLTEFTGFDVCGIFIGSGSVAGFTDPALVMPGASDTRLLNPDGYSRWWNPSEFPVNTGTIFGYSDGMLGTPDSFAGYNATLNGCKYFCDDLNPDDALDEITIENRGMFSAGQKNIRHYTIEMGDDGLIFNYAVDASWVFPEGGPPFSAPDDFPANANRAEAYRVAVSETENSLWNDGIDSGGDLSLTIDVYDWANADMNVVRIESPGNFAMAETAAASGGGEGYSTYELDISDATPDEGEIEILISAASDVEDFEGFIQGTNATAYFTYTAQVSDEAPAGHHWEFDDIATFTGAHPSVMNVSEFDQFSPALCEESDGDIALHWVGDDSNIQVDPNYGGVTWVRYSTDNGITYGNEHWRSWSINSYQRLDFAKIAPGTQENAYCTSRYSGDITYSDLFRIEDHPTDNERAAAIAYASDNLEVIVDSSGYVYAIDDVGAGINLKHSAYPEILDPTLWTTVPSFQVVTDGSLSHVRSSGKDSAGMIWLAYFNGAQSQIRLAHPTDAAPHETWDGSIIVYTAGAGISQVTNPSLWIDGNDTFHICFTQYNSSTSRYELVYTYDDSAFDNPVTTVVVDYAAVINDAHISVGEKSGNEVVIFFYENNKSIYLLTLVDGDPIGPPEDIGVNADDIDPDAILDADQCDMHAVWATLDGNNYDIARRNGVLMEN